MRLLLLDRCELMGWLVDRLLPDGVEVERVGTFDEARARLLDHGPVVAIFDLTPCVGPWEELASLCEEARPPIPFRWTSADESLIEQKGLPERQRSQLLCRPLPVESLRWELKALLEEAEASANAFGGPGAEAEH